MYSVKRQFIDGPYGQIHLRTCGPLESEKRPLLLFHMFPQSGRNFETLMPQIGKDRLVIAPDFPGHGESAIPPEPIDALDYAKSMWNVVEQLGLLDQHGKIDLFGIHAGAKLAVAFAHLYPDQVRRIMLCSAAVLYEEELNNLKSLFKPIPLDEAGTRFQRLWQLLLNNRAPGVTLEMAATGLAEMLRGGEAYEWGHHAVFDYNSIFPDQLSALPHEIALINPADDLKEYTPRSEAYLQNGVLINRPAWSHGFMDLNAQDFAVDISSFFDDGIGALKQPEASTS